MVQRAAAELICNLSMDEALRKMYSEVAGAGNRVHLLLALCDVDDEATRSAASGALAILSTGSQRSASCWLSGILVEIVADLVTQSAPDSLKARGAAVIHNLSSHGQEKIAQDIIARLTRKS